MALTTSLKGRVRNTGLPKSHALLPVIEAIVNSIQAIDSRFGEDVEQGRISVRIERSAQGELDLGPVSPGRVALKPIVGFRVEDNGVGFTPDNMDSFETLDSEFKAELGCRGVGRLLWLKAFDRVEVRSGYVDGGGRLCGRQFRFSKDHEVEHDADPSDPAEPGTSVRLERFRESYQRSAAKSVDAIAREVFEHCIWYFLRPIGAPKITVSDEDGSVLLQDLMDEYVYSSMSTTTIEVKGEKFDMVNLRLKSSTRNPTPRLSWCAASRVVMEENLTGKVPGLYGRLKDENATEFTYVCYLSSDYLDNHVRADRTAFDISERVADPSLLDDISIGDIRAAVLTKAEEILADPLAAARAEGETRVNDFVSNHAPRYRPVMSRLEPLGLTVDPTIKDQDLENLLHRGLQKLEAEVLAEGQAVFAEVGSAPPEEYEDRLANFLDTVTEINQTDLAAYVFRRRQILELLAKLIRSDDQGKYSKEETIHSLIFPMRKDSNEVSGDTSNLWIIDERLAFHDYLASDKTLKRMPITGSESTTEPDLLATRVVDGPVLAAEGESLPLPSIVVVEFKRPMRNDAKEDKDPIQQCLEYVKRVREGGVRTASGRQIPKSQEIPAFCYVIADLTPTMITRCEYANLRPTHDSLAYFGFNEPNKAYIEVISFDGLVNAAAQRNRAFFDRLGLPTA